MVTMNLLSHLIDYQKKGMIRDDDLYDIIVKGMPDGVHVVCLVRIFLLDLTSTACWYKFHVAYMIFVVLCDGSDGLLPQRNCSRSPLQILA
jgi:hypothetical protein